MTGTPTGADDGEPRRQRLIQQLRRLGWPPYVVVAITLTIAVVCIGLVVSGRAQDGTDVILLVAGFGAGVIALMALIVLAYQVRHMARDPEDVGRPGIIDYLILGALPFLVLVGGVLTYYAISQSDIKLPDQLSTTFFLAFSVIALLLSLSMTAIFFSWVKLSDPKQALGLPEGSVRAVIALSLIIIFSITAVFLYTQVSNSSILTSTGLTADQVALIPASERLDTTAEALPTPDPAATPLPPGATPTPAEQTFTVRRIDPAQRTGNELAQQIVTTVSTLVVAVSAFYFGSSSVKSATEALAAATAGVGMKVSAPRQRSRLRRENGKFSLVDVVVDSTPPNQAIVGEILSGDLDGKIAQTDPGAFTYSPVNPDEKVLLRFALVADQTTNATLVLLRDEETPSATGSGAKRSPESPDDGGDATDGKGEFEPPPGGPPPGGPPPGGPAPGGPAATDTQRRRARRQRQGLQAVDEELPAALDRDKAEVPPENPEDGETDEPEASAEPEIPAAQPSRSDADVARQMGEAPPSAAPSSSAGDEAMGRILDERGGRRSKGGGIFSSD